MKWRILAALAGLVPAIALALRDGRVTPDELEQLGERLLDALAGLLAGGPRDPRP